MFKLLHVQLNSIRNVFKLGTYPKNLLLNLSPDCLIRLSQVLTCLLRTARGSGFGRASFRLSEPGSAAGTLILTAPEHSVGTESHQITSRTGPTHTFHPHS